MHVTLDAEQRLYVIASGEGFSCLSFDDAATVGEASSGTAKHLERSRPRAIARTTAAGDVLREDFAKWPDR